MAAAVREHRSAYFAARNGSGRTGLVNQGDFGHFEFEFEFWREAYE